MKNKNKDNRITITRKIQIIPYVNLEDKEKEKEEINRIYKYLRDGMEVESIMANQYMTSLYDFCVKHKLKNIKSASKVGLTNELKELDKIYSRVPNEKKGDGYSFYDFSLEKYPVGLPTAGGIPNNYKPKFEKACKDGLMYGKVSLPTYKKTNPLTVHVDFVKPMIFNKKPIYAKGEDGKSDKNTIIGYKEVKSGMYHNYESHMDLLDALEKGKPEIFIKFANNITFKIVFGNPYKSRELRSVFKQIFEEYYIVQGSSIQFAKKDDGKIMLNLSLSIPIQQHELDENIVVGVDLGIKIPAMCSVNNDKYSRLPIGSFDDFIRVRTKIKAQKKRLYSSLKNTSGGHGRKKKMKKAYEFGEYENNWVTKYNHMVSKKVIKYALKKNAKYINLEYLKGYDASQFLLQNWSYYQLQQFIEYKAKKNGIEVRYINPCYTSQVCSCCGQHHYGDRKRQDLFVCSNPDCISHEIHKRKDGTEYFNADFNASQNIAKSTLFITEAIEKIVKPKDRVNKMKNEAKEYYNIENDDFCIGYDKDKKDKVA